ncbi:MAG: hypothetical protein AABW89_01925 [Nanoarchaeota archaeon]
MTFKTFLRRFVFFPLILFLVVLLLFFSSQSISAKPISSAGSLVRSVEPGCFQARYLGSDLFPFYVNGQNFVYYTLSGPSFPIPVDIQNFNVLNLGPDHKPFTRDDGLNIQINGSHMPYQLSEEGGSITPKINSKYLVWRDMENFVSVIKVANLGVNGLLEQAEVNNAQVIFSDRNHTITSFNLNEDVLTFVYEDSVQYANAQNILYCDLSLSASTIGSCYNQNKHSVPLPVRPGVRFSEVYGYKENGNYMVLWNEYIDRGMLGVFFFSYYFDSSTRTIAQLGANDNIIKSVTGSFITTHYHDRFYFYFGPFSSPLVVSSGPSDQYGVGGSPSYEGSPGGNYLAGYYKNNKGKWFLGTFSGIEVATPFSDYLNNMVFDSSSRGNFVYHTNNRNRLYFTQCYGF